MLAADTLLTKQWRERMSWWCTVTGMTAGLLTRSGQTATVRTVLEVQGWTEEALKPSSGSFSCSKLLKVAVPLTNRWATYRRLSLQHTSVPTWSLGCSDYLSALREQQRLWTQDINLSDCTGLATLSPRVSSLERNKNIREMLQIR